MKKSPFYAKSLGKEWGKLLLKLSLYLEEIHLQVRPEWDRNYVL